MYDKTSIESIIEFAKRLKNQTLRKMCSQEYVEFQSKGKGSFGQILEKYYFKYDLNSNEEPDFQEVGLELKSSPLKKLRNNEYRSKERLVLNIINYCKVHKEDFESSSFLKKNGHLLLVFYLFQKELDLLDYEIKLIEEWQFPKEDLNIIKQDWEKINQKIKEGKAHELSEGDTFYLGACTKGSKAVKSFRKQPFNTLLAKQRAYSLKQGYINHLLAAISGNEYETYGKIITDSNNLVKTQSFEELIYSKLKPFYGKSGSELELLFGINLNKKAKNYYPSIVKRMLGIQLNQKIEEFEKSEIQLKAIRVEKTNQIVQSVSFPSFEFVEIFNQSWRNSKIKEVVEKKYLFLFFKNDGEKYLFEKVKFWSMPYTDIQEVRKVWLKTKKVIVLGDIIKGYQTDKNGKVTRKINFPKKSENKVCHVRPHGKNSLDTYPLPVPDKLSGDKDFTKQCFWINADYIKNEIYLK